MHSLRREIETEVSTSVEDYGDLLVQNIQTAVDVPASDLPGVLPLNETIGKHDVMGSVNRYGADEGVLLLQKLRDFSFALQGTYSEEVNVEFQYQFGFDGDKLEQAQDDDLSDDVSSNAIVGSFDEVNNDVLYHVSGKATGGFKDAANGAGAAPESFQTRNHINYMTEVGVLPEVSARETLFEHIEATSTTAGDPQDGSLRIFADWQLYWLETDDETEGRDIEL